MVGLDTYIPLLAVGLAFWVDWTGGVVQRYSEHHDPDVALSYLSETLLVALIRLLCCHASRSSQLVHRPSITMIPPIICQTIHDRHQQYQNVGASQKRQKHTTAGIR